MTIKFERENDKIDGFVSGKKKKKKKERRYIVIIVRERERNRIVCSVFADDRQMSNRGEIHRSLTETQTSPC